MSEGAQILLAALLGGLLGWFVIGPLLYDFDAIFPPSYKPPPETDSGPIIRDAKPVRKQ